MGPTLLCHTDRYIGMPMGTINRAPIPPAVMIEGAQHNHSMKQTYENKQGVISPLYPIHGVYYIRQHTLESHGRRDGDAADHEKEQHLVNIELHLSRLNILQYINHSNSRTPIPSPTHPTYHYSRRPLYPHSHQVHHHCLSATSRDLPVSPFSDFRPPSPAQLA
jgi:hypothetical protein